MTALMATACRAWRGLGGGPKPTPITGRRVLAWMIMFFGVIIAVNGVFVYLALDTWPGLSTEQAYEEGRAYNQTLADADAQNALGWRSRAAIGAPTPKGRVLTVRMSDAHGAPIVGLKVHVVLRRPVGDGVIVDATLGEEQPGVYGALVRLPALGRWQLALTANSANDVSYRMGHELRVGP